MESMILVLEIEFNETNHKQIEIERKRRKRNYSRRTERRRIIMAREIRQNVDSLVCVCCIWANDIFGEKKKSKVVT